MAVQPQYKHWRKFAVDAAIVFLVLLLGGHLLASLKASAGISAFLIITDQTRRAFAAWHYVDTHPWLGLVYGVALIFWTAMIGQRKSVSIAFFWITLPAIWVIGFSYFMAVLYLSGKFLA
jgi:hypothetical protein